ncbi:MAG TPA: NUDIX hydrolase [Microthrixaceae bacterium]|nr:NUDIX hydrolase [Microthrixaceae bacterium]
MKWTVHGERSIYDSEWIGLSLVDIEIPELTGHPARRFEHHVVRSRGPAAGTVVTDSAGDVLLLWRHRFITDSWGWEIPAGGVDPGEDPAEAAAREVLEESGWRPGPVEPLIGYFPSNGLSDQRFDLFRAHGATYVGEPSDPSESERIEWLSVSRLRDEITAGNLRDGLSLTAILWCLSFGYL